MKKFTRAKLIDSCSVVFAIFFTIIFFGPFEMMAYNANDLEYTINDVIWCIASVTLFLTIIFTSIIIYLKDSLYKKSMALLFAILICFYLQGNYLNLNIGELTGDSIEWTAYSVQMVVNSIIWILIIIVIYSLRNKQYFLVCLRYISLSLIGMQIVAFLILSINGAFENKRSLYCLTEENMYTYSTQNNVLVFVLDRFDYELVKEILQTDPGFLEEFDGFTLYEDAISNYSNTYPGINYMLTGAKGAMQLPQNEYLDSSWNSEDNLLNQLYEEGYRCDIYTEIQYMFDATKNHKYSQVSNFNVVDKLNQFNAFKRLLRYSLYNYLPIVAKPYYWITTDTMNYMVVNSEDIDRYKVDEVAYYEGLEQFETISENAFKFFHFFGAHAPYTFNEKGEHTGESVTELEQAKGSLYIVQEILRELKKEELYYDASILITTDHPHPRGDDNPVLDVAKILCLYKPSGNSGEELQYSSAPISHDNIPATILKMAGIEYNDVGTPIDEVSEFDIITRSYHKRVIKGEYVDDTTIFEYAITGDAGNFDNWSLVDTWKAVR